MKTYSSLNDNDVSVVGYTKEKKKKHFNNLDLNQITDNKLFWKTVKPLLSDKGVNTTKKFQ